MKKLFSFVMLLCVEFTLIGCEKQELQFIVEEKVSFNTNEFRIFGSRLSLQDVTEFQYNSINLGDHVRIEDDKLFIYKERMWVEIL